MLASLGLHGGTQLLGTWQLPDEPPVPPQAQPNAPETKSQAKRANQVQHELRLLLAQAIGSGKNWNGPKPSAHLSAWCQLHKVSAGCMACLQLCMIAFPQTC